MLASTLLLVGALSIAGVEPAPGLARLLEQTPADSLLAPLRRYEHQQLRGTTAAEAAFALGQLHLIRGEYRLAADAFSRAAAGFEPARKGEALYWVGIAWLGVPDPHRARGSLEVVVRGGGPRRDPAALGIAETWMLENRPENAIRILSRLVARRSGEVTPAALGRLAAVAQRLRAPEVARIANERLRRDYPRSFEARGIGPDPVAPVPHP